MANTLMLGALLMCFVACRPPLISLDCKKINRNYEQVEIQQEEEEEGKDREMGDIRGGQVLTRAFSTP